MALSVDDLKTVEIGQLYYRLCAFDKALSVIEPGLELAEAKEDWGEFCRLITLAIRMWADRMEFDRVDRWVPRLEQVPEHSRPASIPYVLGIVATYRGDLDRAGMLFQSSLEKSEKTRDRAQALFGIATVAAGRKNYESVLTQLDSLQGELESSTLVDLRVACAVLRAVVYRNQKRYDEALVVLIGSQKLCQRESNLFMALNTLFGIGCVYLEKGELDKAADYFQLVENLVDLSELKHLAIQLNQRKVQLAAARSKDQIVRLIDAGERSVVLPTGKKVDLKKQFVLLNLLKLFGTEPGRSVSKEDIVRKVWKEEYHPLRHDNKIHATVLRLRRLIEDDARHPAYILNTQDGYCMNSKYSFSVLGAQA